LTIIIENEYPGYDPEFDKGIDITATAQQKLNLRRFLKPEEYEEIANNVVLEALEQEGCPYEAEVDIVLVDDLAIREFNNENRGIDLSTDVLSFPMIDFGEPADFSSLESMEVKDEFAYMADDVFNPDTGELLLGDIVISIDHCLLQADEYGHDIRREFAFLIAHSMLHLMGYDHMTPEDAACMEKKQEAILTKLGYTR
jgi:probable rRNA maturation factor